jgi:tetratricopeptide (TPR) repeat protein
MEESDVSGSAPDGDDYLQARAGRLRQQAEEARREGRGSAAVDLYQQAVALLRQANSPLRLAHTLRHLADVHCEAGNPAPAEPLYREALELYRSSANTPGLELANALRPLALLLTGRGDHDEARLLWLEARTLYAAAGVGAGVEECERRLNPDAGS